MCGIPLNFALPIIILGIISGMILGMTRPDLVYEFRRWISHKHNAIKLFAIATAIYFFIGLVSRFLC